MPRPDDDAPAFADDEPLFADDVPAAVAKAPPPHRGRGPTWKVLTVDDDEAVHQVTRLALRGLAFDGCAVELVHAHSAEEARQLLTSQADWALLLLDVVMETDDAGLRLVNWVRGELGNATLRIILRTGQPGMAPEDAIMAQYDIHDYHAKTELSARRLRTAVTGGLRAYRDVRALVLQRQGLEKVIAATAALFAPHQLEQLLGGILEQVAALLVPREHAIFFLARRPLFADAPLCPEPVVLAGSGRFAVHNGQPLSAVLGSADLGAVERAIRPGEWSFHENHGLFGFDVGEPSLPALLLEDARSLSEWERQTIAMFCSSAAMALRNQRLYLERSGLMSAFARFVPEEFLRLVGRDDIRRVAIGDQQVRAMTVLFLDVEGFTARSDVLDPAAVLELLNRIFAVLAPVFAAHGGVVDKYLGDGVMVLFPQGPAPALRAVVGVQQAIAELNLAPDLRDTPVLLRASLEHGEVILGTVGHAGRFDTTVISDVVNVAARLQGWCRTLDARVLATEHCIDPAIAPFARDVGDVPIRGRRAPVAVWELFDGDDDALRSAKLRTRAMFAQAVAHRRAGRWPDAIDVLRQVLAVDARDGAARWMLHDALRAAREGASLVSER